MQMAALQIVESVIFPASLNITTSCRSLSILVIHPLRSADKRYPTCSDFGIINSWRAQSYEGFVPANRFPGVREGTRNIIKSHLDGMNSHCEKGK